MADNLDHDRCDNQELDSREHSPTLIPDSAGPAPGHRDSEEQLSLGVTRKTPLVPGGARQPRAPSEIFAAGSVVADRYRIEQLLGQGGMGQVYQAEDLQLGVRVALKTIQPGMGDSAAARELFKQEINLARRVSHGNVCRIYDLGIHALPAGETGEVPRVFFLTMELLDGQTLRERLQERGPFSPEEALPVAEQIAAGLDAAHRHGIIHRDLKSANVMLVPSEDPDIGQRVVVTDFGLAHSDRTGGQPVSERGMMVGTPAYMAPEQVQGAPVTAAADIYAFGIVLYEMLTGVRPFDGGSALTVATRRLTEPPQPLRQLRPDLDQRWEEAVLRCLELQPKDRFASAPDLIRAIRSSTLAAGAALKTLLLSDLVDSTALVERLGDERAFAIFGRHDRVARDLLQRFNGREIDKTDGFLLLFDRPIDALGYAIAYHQALAELSREVLTEIKSRVGIHVGEVFLRENPPEDVARGAKPLEVEGLSKPVAARLMSLAMGGQTLLTRSAFDLARHARAAAGLEELQWLAHGAYRFKGVDEPIKVFEAGLPGVAPLAPPPSSVKVQRLGEDETILGWRPAPGQEMPLRPHWRLERKLGEGGFGEVWLGEHRKTRERRVFKFCFDKEHLRGLQREVTLFRLLKDALGNRDDIARIIDWNFDQFPYFVESEFTEGGSILDWAQRHGGIAAIPLQRRLELAAQAADALAAAHSVGVLHKDLKPGNVLVHEGPDDSLQARLADFGIGLVTDQNILSGSGITMLGFTDTGLGEDIAMAGTRLYMAPEQLEGKLPTVQADIYAFGVMLYQLVVGDLRRALAPGWEREVTDELLREDIAALVDGDPTRRLSDAAVAARRLFRLEKRRARRRAEEQARREAEQARQALERSRKRRKLVVATVASLAVFAVAMGIQSWRIAREAERAEREAERAEREAETARQVSDFLLGLFEEAQPEKARGAAITAQELVDQGAERVEQDLQQQPEVRARIMQMLGKVYFKLGSYPQAERFWERTIALQRAQAGRVDVTVATSLGNLATVYATKGQLDRAEELFSQALTLKEEVLGGEHEEVAGLLSNLAVLYRRQERYQEALPLAQRALAVYEKVEGVGSTRVGSVLINLANLYRDTGRYQEAESCLVRSLEILERNEGKDHPRIATVLSSLASVWVVLERLSEAEQLNRRALELRTKVLGTEHPLIALNLLQLGEVLLLQERVDEAVPLLERALQIAESRMGADHLAVAEILVPLADAERRRQRFTQAEQLLARSRSISENELGPDSVAVAAPLFILGLVRHDTGRPAEAATLLERSLHLVEEGQGAHHPDLLRILPSLAMVSEQLGRDDEAAELRERAGQIRTRLLGSDPHSPA